ncbi:MAG: shikimate kinase [bacterium]
MSGRPNPRHNITFCGFHATGKSSTAQVVARRMRRQLADFHDEVERRSRLNLYTIARIGRKPEQEDVETKLLADLSYRRETVVALDCASDNYLEAVESLSEVSYVVMLDPPFDVIWQRLEADRRYAALLSRHGRTGLYGMWKQASASRQHADLLLTDPRLSILDAARLVLHCFFT